MATIIDNILGGKYDNSLDRIAKAVRERQENRIYDLKVGDRVKFNQQTRPEYLRGSKATIVQWRRSRVLIQLEDGEYLGRFIRGGGKIIAHPGSLIPIDKEQPIDET